MNLKSVSPLGLAVLVICMASLLGPVGCAARKVNTVQSVGGDKLSQVDNVHKVKNDGSLDKKAHIAEVRRVVTGSNVLKIQAKVVNSTRTRKRVRYRVEWLDDNGMVIDTIQTMWHPLDLNGKEVVHVTQVAPTPKATNYKITLKEADR